MPKNTKVRLILILLISIVFLQLIVSTILFIAFRESFDGKSHYFLVFSIGTSLIVFVFLHLFYFLLLREKNGIIKRLDEALMTSLNENEKLEEKKHDLEIQLRHTQKLESIGTLARGMAHDFNNLLSPILGYSDLALSGLSKEDPHFLYINEIVRAAAKAKEQVEQVLNFSHNIDSESGKADLSAIIEETVMVIRPLIPTTVEIKLDLYVEPIFTKADHQAINQIIVNLCTNGWQAMEDNGGTLTISTTLINEDKKYALIRVSDTGMGIDNETEKHIFEPFFSTRTEKSSSGLGLSVVQGIVGSGGGKVEVDSTPGLGSVFSIYLPVKTQRAAGEEEAGDSDREGKILLVDDDENITGLICTMLSDIGYSVELFNDSEEALRVFASDPWRYKLVITDLTMPRMTGSEMKKKMMVIRDDIPVLIMTGYGSKKEEGDRQILKKPFVRNELLTAIESLLQ